MACSLSKRQNRIVGVARERLGPQPGTPAERRRPVLVRAEHAAGHVLPGEDQLDVEVELIVGEEPSKRPQELVTAPGGQESLVLLPRQRPEAEAHAGLLVPDLIAHHGAEPDLLGGPRLVAHAALRAWRQRIPAA